MSSVDTAPLCAIKPLTPMAAALVPNPLGHRLRVRQRLGAQVYVADVVVSPNDPSMDASSSKKMVLKLGRLQQPPRDERHNHSHPLGAAQEVRIARQLRAFGGHRNIVQVVETCVDQNFAFVVMEHCSGGDLFTHLVQSADARFPQHDALRKLHQIASGVQYLHQHNIAHRDLSLENVLLQENECKICDFGLSARADILTNDVVGKTQYAAPEVVQGAWYDPVRADMWSLGIMLFMMLTGSPLVQFASPSCPEFNALRCVGVRGVLRAWGMEALFSAAVIDLLSKLLELNPERRLASAQHLLSHSVVVAALAVPVAVAAARV